MTRTAGDLANIAGIVAAYREAMHTYDATIHREQATAIDIAHVSFTLKAIEAAIDECPYAQAAWGEILDDAEAMTQDQLNTWTKKRYLTHNQMKQAKDAGFYTIYHALIGTTFCLVAHPTGSGPSFQFTHSTETWFVIA